MAVEMMAYSGKSMKEMLTDLAAQYGTVCSERIDIKTTASTQARVLADLKEFQPRVFAGVKVDRFNELEGKQMLLEDGSWILIRPSGTEPLFRIYVEAASPERLQELKNEILKQLVL
jgi:phosphomannomutase